MSTQPQPTAAQLQDLMTRAANESQPHEAAVAFDDLCGVALSPLWGIMPKGQNALPDETISSHISDVANDPHAKLRVFPVLVNKALNFLNPNKVKEPDGTTEELGHGVGAKAGDVIRAARILAIVMKDLGIPSLTITAGEDPAAIIASVTVGK